MLRPPFLRLLLFGTGLLALGCGQESKLISVLPTLAVSSTSVTPVGTVGGAPVTETVTIVNGTDGTLEGLSVSVQFLGGPTGWLSATLNQTSATRSQPASIQLRATPGSLGLGVYLAKAVVSAQGAGNGPITVAVRLTIDPRPPTKLGIVTQASGQVPNGDVFDRQPAVQLLNAIDEPAAKAGVVVTVAIGSGGGELVGPTTAVTGPDGRAAFVGLGLLGSVGDRTLTFSAPNLTPVGSSPIGLVPGAAKAIEAASAVVQTADAGTAVAEAPRARVVDQSGNGIQGFPIAFVASAGSSVTPGGTLTTSATGTAGPNSWVLNPVVGANTVTASAAGLAGSPLTFTATGKVGAAADLKKQSGDNVIGLVNSVLGTPHVLKVIDNFGNGVSGVTISWGVTGGGNVNPTSGVTDQNGLAQAVRTLPGAIGAATTTATATIGGTARTVGFGVTVVGIGPALIVKVTGDGQTALAGATLPTPLQVRVTNGLGTPEANVKVTFTTPNGGSFPGGAEINTNANGLASTTWRLGVLAGQQTAQAAVGGPPPAEFAATATAGAVDNNQSTVAVSPTTITAGGAGSQITVTARDAGGNPISGLPVILGVTGAATTTPIGPTNASGQATSTLTATVAGAKLVSASVGGTLIAQSATVTVVAGLPTQITALVSTSPSVRFGQAVTPAPSVQVRDAFGNGVPNVPMTFGITTGQSSVAAPSTTNAAGVATATWTIAALFGGPGPSNVRNTLIATATGAGIAGNPITFVGTAAVSFASDLVPFFRRTQATGGCTNSSCHGNSNPGQVPNYDQATASLYAFLAVNRYVVAGDSTNSSTSTNLLWRNPALGHTPGPFPSNLVTIIKAWVRQGAPNN